jgi:DnaJ-class molecular chaperone
MGKLLLVAALALGAWFWWRGRRAAMSAAEARALLGVDRAASENDVRAAHRRLIQRVHPDAGGSAALATKVNAARDVLLAELGRN